MHPDMSARFWVGAP